MPTGKTLLEIVPGVRETMAGLPKGPWGGRDHSKSPDRNVNKGECGAWGMGDWMQGVWMRSFYRTTKMTMWVPTYVHGILTPMLLDTGTSHSVLTIDAYQLHTGG